MAKRKVKFSFKFLLLPLILTVLALVGAFMLPKNQSVEPIEEESVVNNETKVEETFENGVYINHTYGFKFNYDEELFDLTTDWRRDLNSKFISANDNPDLLLRISFVDIWERRSDMNYIKLYDIPNGEAFLITSSNTADDGDLIPTYIVVYKNEKGFTLISLAHKKGVIELAKYKTLFDGMAKSLH